MAKKTYTQDDVEKARALLNDLPDLSRQKLGQAEVLIDLRDQIVALSSSKGYSNAEIKSALSQVGIDVSVSAIADIITVRKRSPGRKKTSVEKQENPSS